MEMRKPELKFETDVLPSSAERGSTGLDSPIEGEWTESNELADSTVDLSFSGYSENWESTDNLDARILEIRGEYVRLDVLIDRDKKQFEERTYPRDLLDGAVKLEAGRYVLIRIFRGRGKIKFTFHNGDGVVNKDFFEDLTRFRDLDDIDFDKVL